MLKTILDVGIPLFWKGAFMNIFFKFTYFWTNSIPAIITEWETESFCSPVLVSRFSLRKFPSEYGVWFNMFLALVALRGYFIGTSSLVAMLDGNRIGIATLENWMFGTERKYCFLYTLPWLVRLTAHIGTAIKAMYNAWLDLGFQMSFFQHEAMLAFTVYIGFHSLVLFLSGYLAYTCCKTVNDVDLQYRSREKEYLIKMNKRGK